MGCGFSHIFQNLLGLKPKEKELNFEFQDLFGDLFPTGINDVERVKLYTESLEKCEGNYCQEIADSTIYRSTDVQRVKLRRKKNSLSKRELYADSVAYNINMVTMEEAAEIAVRNRNKEQLQRIITKCGEGFSLIPVHGLPKRKKNAVELACTLGYYDIVEVFLDNGCSPNLPTTAGKLLHSVLESLKSHKECVSVGRRVVRSLCEKGCDLNIKDYRGNTPLMHCAQIGDCIILKEILFRCSELQLSYRCSGSQNTPLHMSVMRGDYECVKLLLSRSPHKHVDLVDRYGNTALHLALKSMLHNIPYLNAARQHIEFSADETSSQKAAACEKLMRFQHNTVAIVEELIMAGADLHAVCCRPDFMNFQYYPLVYALQLCAEDETEGFDFQQGKFSSTLHLVSKQTIQSLEDWSKAWKEDTVTVAGSCPKKLSVYAGVVRLLVLAGTLVSSSMRAELYNRFGNIGHLLDELCVFWDRYRVEKPPKLIHLSKQRIRSHLASLHRLHEINLLPLPVRLQDYIKLHYL